MTSPIVLKFQRWDELPADEEAALEEISLRTKTYDAGAEIAAQGSRPTECCLLLEGYVGRATLLSDGGRQIGAIHIAGDFVDIHSFVLKKLDHSIFAITRCTVAAVPHSVVRKLSDEFPHLARLLWLNTAVDGAIHREWLAALGRRTAEAHFAHLLCELYLRLKDVKLIEGTTYRLPMTQILMADVLGLSPVHVNRTLQKLRRDGLVEWEASMIEILDWDRLAELADFDDTYLSRNHEPR